MLWNIFITRSRRIVAYFGAPFPCYDIGGKDNAVKSANNYRSLRKKGITVRKTIDVMIATFCIENDFILLHNDKDFYPFEKYLKLRVYQK